MKKRNTLRRQYKRFSQHYLFFTLGGPILLALLLIIWSSILFFTAQHPLNDAHWDSPIYLLGGKNYAQGNHLQSFIDRAEQIYSTVMDGEYPTGGYWPFMRLGHILLNGVLIDIWGTDERSIYVVTWAYHLFFTVSLFFIGLLSIQLAKTFSPNLPVTAYGYGALASMVVYLLSDISTYLSGNLVSEIPTLMLFSISAWSLIQAWKKQSLVYASVSGFLAFLIYVTRMETIWLYVSFLIVTVLFFSTKRSKRKIWWLGLLTTGIFSGIPFLVYSAVFFPLTDPRLILAFSKSAGQFFLNDPAGIPISNQLFSAIGLLWVGTFLSLPLFKADRSVQFGTIWLILSLIPVGLAVVNQNSTQTRMFTTYTPVFMLLSTLGWAHLFAKFKNSFSIKIKFFIVGALCIFFALISQPASYSLLRELPGMWRLQFVRTYLSPPAYERIDYYLPELFLIGRFLNELEPPPILVASPGMQVADHVQIIQYLHNPLKGVQQDTKRDKNNSEDRSSSDLQVYLSDKLTEDIQFLNTISNNGQVLLLSTSEEKEWVNTFSSNGKINKILSTNHFSLAEITTLTRAQKRPGYGTFGQ